MAKASQPHMPGAGKKGPLDAKAPVQTRQGPFRYQDTPGDARGKQKKGQPGQPGGKGIL